MSSSSVSEIESLIFCGHADARYKEEQQCFQITEEGREIRLLGILILWHASYDLKGVEMNVDVRGCKRVWKHIRELVLQPKVAVN